MRKKIRAFNYELEVSTNALAPWSRIKVYDIREGRFFGPSYGKHIVWGKLSIIFGQPHLMPITVCGYCGEEITQVGEDCLDWCESCQCVEGETKEITMEEYERSQS